MASVHERLEALETRMNEQSHGTSELAKRIDALGETLGGRIDALGEKLSHRIDALDHRIDALGHRIDALGDRLDGRIDTLDRKLDRRVDALDQKVDRVMAFQVAMLFALVGGLVTAVLRHWV
jgi:tetrahydromethanopterin S-methyltransferase subunit G